jgi:uncharacterized zinc-type alcohol dehydrogenase-like protein
MDFERRKPREDDIVVQILYCGVCHSDWHTILNEWKNTKYPLIPGHEVSGKVIKIGSKVTKFVVGDHVAMGPNYNSCLQCPQCTKGFVEYCDNDLTEIYNSPDRRPGELKPTGAITYGGYSNVIIIREQFAFKIPNNIPLDRVAPLLCAGVTMYFPLKYFGVKPGDKVAIAGIGGLGHMGIKLAKAMGAHVTALTRTVEKLSDSKRLGADDAFLIYDDKLKPYLNTFDLVIDTIPFAHDSSPYLDLIKTMGTYWNIGCFYTQAIDMDKVNRKAKIIRGSIMAGIPDTAELIEFCINNNIYPETQIIDIKDINKTHEMLKTSKVRYRYVIDMTSIYKQ